MNANFIKGVFFFITLFLTFTANAWYTIILAVAMWIVMINIFATTTEKNIKKFTGLYWFEKMLGHTNFKIDE